MVNQMEEKQSICGYELVASISEDSIYKWFRATKDNKTVILQVLQTQVSEAEANLLFEHFASLNDFKNKSGFVVPETTRKELNSPIVSVYSTWSEKTKTLAEFLDQQPENAKELWKQATEIIHILHQQEIHGNLNPSSFVVVENKVYLRGFGYAPLINSRNQSVIKSLKKEYKNYLAPEVGTDNLTKASDIYAFAKIIADLQPKLTATDWYLQVTDPNPNKRNFRIREIGDRLEAELEKLDPESPVEQKTTKNIGSPLIPKYTLTVTAKPSGSGEIEGDGLYELDEQVTVKAIAKQNWRFTHWSGAVNGSDHTVTLKIDRNLEVVANFQLLTEFTPEEVPLNHQEITQIEKNEEKNNSNNQRRNWKLIISVLATILVTGGIAGLVIWQSANISFLCRSQGNCTEYTNLYNEVEKKGKESKTLAEQAQNINQLQNARAQLQNTLTELDKIPDNAKIQPQVTTLKQEYETQIKAIDDKLAKEEIYETQIASIEASAQTLTNWTETAKSAKNIQDLQRVKSEWEKLRVKLAEIPNDAFVIEKVNQIKAKYNSKIQEIDQKIQKIIAERKVVPVIPKPVPSSPTPKRNNVNLTVNQKSTSNLPKRTPKPRQRIAPQTQPPQRKQPSRSRVRTQPTPTKKPPLWPQGNDNSSGERLF
ncbi:MAG: hypothetical protein RLZZ507_106 [Cyanobacteriota bacterium]|jgi:hypothetical protein